ncbi:hypothetical protein BCL79_2754 [Stenotrophomonas rhizophila]|uniref:Uncharacterized protein n=1 Tax=Stenotrophomonas rhizophila TaxID=216778 RepID=A0A498CEI1_9GAMM|nr:hypothetical protein [Stenotrophomonas rhizophila]RLK53447.1 hypothetical protein BCL79_2754 [Stenotrophomonas rhizophila]
MSVFDESRGYLREMREEPSSAVGEAAAVAAEVIHNDGFGEG